MLYSVSLRDIVNPFCKDVGKTKYGPIKGFLLLSQEARKSMHRVSAGRLPLNGWYGTTESASASQPPMHVKEKRCTGFFLKAK